MKHANLLTSATAISLALGALTLSAGQAMAADTDQPKTRAEVMEELEEAKRMGEIPASDESGLLLRDQYPERYPPKASQPSLTREEVRQELERAQKAGEVPIPATD
jgi:hypothetical protein